MKETEIQRTTPEFETDRLLLRPWKTEDVNLLYQLASDPEVGPPCGWNPHQSLSESREVLENILMVPNTWAICVKENGQVIGNISLMEYPKRSPYNSGTQAESGYWLGSDYWGYGYTPEALRRIMKYAFEDLNVQQIWIGYFDGNTKSQRCAAKCGFQERFVNRNVDWPLLGCRFDIHMLSADSGSWKNENGN